MSTEGEVQGMKSYLVSNTFYPIAGTVWYLSTQHSLVHQ